MPTRRRIVIEYETDLRGAHIAFAERVIDYANEICPFECEMICEAQTVTDMNTDTVRVALAPEEN